MKIETQAYTVEVRSLGRDTGWCGIYGDKESLDAVTNSIILCGTDEDSGIVPITGGLKMREFTVVLWLQQEVYGFLEEIEFE